MKSTRTVEDLYLASWLMCNDVVLHGHERTYGYSTFYFEGGPKTDRLVEEFTTNGLLNKFARSLRQLKSIMYAGDGRTTHVSQVTQHVKQAKGNYAGA